MFGRSLIMKSRRAFTLIELLVVMIVIALLALVVVPQFASRSTQAREVNLRSNLKAIRNALQMWRADTATFPADLARLTATSAPTGVIGWNGPYLTAPMPQDPTVASSSGSNGNWSYTASSGAVASSNSSYASW
jgi:general secretion pathway protein G